MRQNLEDEWLSKPTIELQRFLNRYPRRRCIAVGKFFLRKWLKYAKKVFTLPVSIFSTIVVPLTRKATNIVLILINVYTIVRDSVW